MATKYAVFFDFQQAGNNRGLWSNQTEAKNLGFPETVKVVEVEAATEQEAATGVRRAYGDANVGSAMVVYAVSNKHEITAP